MTGIRTGEPRGGRGVRDVHPVLQRAEAGAAGGRIEGDQLAVEHRVDRAERVPHGAYFGIADGDVAVVARERDDARRPSA